MYNTSKHVSLTQQNASLVIHAGYDGGDIAELPPSYPA